MLNFLGFILLLVLLFIIGTTIFARIIMRKLFGGFDNTQSPNNKHRTDFSNRNNSKNRNGQKSGKKNKKKIFTKDEGTYIDFVEVKN